VSIPPSEYPCPACGAWANLSAGCPGCGRAPEPIAAEVIRLDGEIVALTGQVEQARRAYTALTVTLGDTRRRRDELAAQVRALAFVGRRAEPPAAPPPAAPVRPEASARAVQNLLFVLGGLLLCTAAIVFMVVTWAVVGVAGRAAILAVITGLALATPPLTKRRGLTATAETFAVVGLLLVVLDGYAAWTVNLFGVADWSGTYYAALVWGVSAAVAAGYERLTRLAAPWFAALVLVQPVLPLLAYNLRPGPAGWSLVFAASAGLNLVLVHRARSARAASAGVTLARQLTGWVAYAAGLATAALCGLGALLVADGPGSPVLAGGPLLVAVAVLVAGAVLARNEGVQAAAGFVVVVTLAGAALRPVAELRWSMLLVASGVIVALLAGAVVLTARRLPAVVRRGPWVGGLLISGVLAQLTGALAVVVAVETVTRSWPIWRAAGTGPVTSLDWQAPATMLLVAAALAALLPRSAREPVGVVGAGLAVLAFPAAVALPWWAVATLEVTVAVALLLAAARVRANGSGTLVVRAGAGALLAGHAFLVSLARPASAAAVLGAILLAGLAVAVLAASRPEVRRAPVSDAAGVGGDAAGVGGDATGVGGGAGGVGSGVDTGLATVRRAIGGAALAVGLLAVPATVTVGLFAAGVAPWWQARAALATGTLLLAAVAVVRRRWPEYLPYVDTALAGAALVTGLAPLFGQTGEPIGLYSAIGLLLVVAGLLVAGRLTTWRVSTQATAGPAGAGQGHVGPISATVFCAPVLAFSATAAVASAIGAVLLGPYGWLDRIWSGAQAGVGLAPAGWPVNGPSGAALVVLTGVAALAGWGWRRTIAGALLAAFPLAATALLVVLAAAGARWPVVPAVALLSGLAALLAAALAPPIRALKPAGTTESDHAAVSDHPVASGGSWVGLVVVPLGVLLTGAGLAGALPAKASTLVALGLLVLAGAVAGAAGTGGGAAGTGGGAAGTVAGAAGAVGGAGAAGSPVGGSARLPVVRIAGWLVATGAGVTLAVAAARAADLPLRVAAFAVLGVAAVALAGGAALGRRRPVESVAIEAAGHAGAVVALLLTSGEIRYTAAVATFWGVAVGIRALRPGESARRRSILASVAAGCELLAVWLLLTAEQVALLEAYTLPAAASALVAGALAVRAWPALSSWVSYGTGLTAALLPSLASVLVAGDQPWRRLLLGVGALAVVLVGSRWRKQAPVLLGGGTLAVLALHEVVGAWDRLPRWIFLAAGGFALIGLAISYERRRRDLARWRATVGRMS
jgi:hypothetical protein